MSLYTRILTSPALAPGYAGLEYAVKSYDDTVLISRRSTGLQEWLGSGQFRVAVANWDSTWSGYIEWTGASGATPLDLQDFQPLDLGSLLSSDIATLLNRLSPSRATLLDNLASLDNPISAVGSLVWNYPGVRTISLNAVQIAANLAGNHLPILRGDTLVVNFPPLGNLSARTVLWFTLKDGDGPDAQAIVQAIENVGLAVLEKKPASQPSWGSLSVLNAVLGITSLTLKADATSLLVPKTGRYRWDIQVQDPFGTRTLLLGTSDVQADVTRSIMAATTPTPHPGGIALDFSKASDSMYIPTI